MPAKEEYSVVMASCDVKDAFLQVCQEDPILVTLQGEQFVINRKFARSALGGKTMVSSSSKIFSRAAWVLSFAQNNRV